jgi:simple sugar transport system permease protein
MSAPAISTSNSNRLLFQIARQIFLPLLGIFTALLVGAVIIFVSGFNPLDAYGGLFSGAFGNWEAVNATLATATPYIFTTLAVAFAFQAGLFNIGAEGQLRVGAIAAAWMGVNVGGWSPFLAIPLTLVAGWLGGALWGAIPGALKAFSGAHEVITTIMLNYISAFITSYLVGSDGPLRGTRFNSTKEIGENARISPIVSDNPLHWGFLIAIITAFFIYWLLNRTPIGFEIRTVGANPSAARYAGIKVSRITIITMAASGLLAGMAGALEVMGSPGLYYRYNANLGSGYGFDSIAIALLGKNNPIAAIPAALLYAALRSGAAKMQFQTVDANGQQLPGDLISIIQALVIIFVAADQVLRWLYRMRQKSDGDAIVLSRGWGKAE